MMLQSLITGLCTNHVPARVLISWLNKLIKRILIKSHLFHTSFKLFALSLMMHNHISLSSSTISSCDFNIALPQGGRAENELSARQSKVAFSRGETSLALDCS